MPTSSFYEIMVGDETGLGKTIRRLDDIRKIAPRDGFPHESKHESYFPVSPGTQCAETA
jgi:hypothetical protein